LTEYNVSVLLKQLTKNKDKVGDTSPANNLKSKAALIISLFAAIYSFNAFMSGQISSSIFNNTIKANDTWAFYQAKSIKQTLTEMRYDDAVAAKEDKKAEALKAKMDRYESEPATGEGKKELFAKARTLEADRAVAKDRSPWYTFAGSLFQIAIVLLSASILAVNNRLYTASLYVGGVAIILMSQAVWLWIPAVI
jgi:hypothetical protein